jgi:hypothetical protein
MLLAASWAKDDFSPSDFDSGRLGNYLGAETRIGMAVAKRRGLRRAITAVPAGAEEANRHRSISQTEQGCRSLDARVGLAISGSFLARHLCLEIGRCAGARGMLLMTFVSGIHNPKIMLGMLVKVFRGDSIATRSGLARKSNVAF